LRAAIEADVIYLCSSSSTRASLLKRFGIEFIQKVPRYDEDQITETVPKDFVYLAGKGKLEAAQKEFGLDCPLLTADTVIASESGEILRKAKNIEDARRILEIQSGSAIAIITSLHYKAKHIYFTDTSATYYRFASFPPLEIERYLQSALWEGKAGACMVEGFCKPYIQEVRGMESTAMGLQVEKLLPWLKEIGHG